MNNNTQLILKMHLNNIGVERIAKVLDITTTEVEKTLYNNNIDIARNPYFIHDEEICQLYKEGSSIMELATKFNKNRHTITNVLKRNKVEEYKNKQAKINSPDKQDRNKEIIALYQSGLTCREVSKKLQICASTVSNVLRYYNIEARKPNERGHSKHTSKNRKYFFDLNFFEVIDTEEKAYWLGFMYADGYVSTGKGAMSLALQEQDLDHIKAFQKSLKAEDIPLKYNNQNKSYKFNFCSTKMTDDLVKLGCLQAKSLILEFPTEEQVPRELIHHFMRGYFDGDGCISNKTFSVLGTKQFLDEYEKILLEGINKKAPTKRIHQDHWSETTECITYGGRLQCLKIYDFLYKDATIYLERKYNKFQKLLPS